MTGNQKKLYLVIALLMIGGMAGVLACLKSNQRLGLPGVKTAPLAGSQNLEVLLPESVPGFKSEWMETDKIVVDRLPKDTSYGQRRYKSEDGQFFSQATVVLMGSDRTSIHKPQYCLTGQGWVIDPVVSRDEIIHVERPYAYDLPVTKLVATRQFKHNEENVTARGVYVYWFVADDAFIADSTGVKRGLWAARELLKSGTLQRWAYVSFFSVCAPGQEEETFKRMKELIAGSVPDFQLSPKPDSQTASVQHQESGEKK